MISVKKGDRVILRIADSKPQPDIPLWDSPYGCVGTALHDNEVSVVIQWDNGERTGFFMHKLELYNKQHKSKNPDPNLAFLHKKRRRECTK